MYAGLELALPFYTTTIAADPSDHSGKTALFAGAGVYRTTDGVATWKFLPPGANNQSTHTDQHAIGFDPAKAGSVFLGNDGGVTIDFSVHPTAKLSAALTAAGDPGGGHGVIAVDPGVKHRVLFARHLAFVSSDGVAN